MRADLRADGWWIVFDQGEEVGPFQRLDDAQAFLDLVDNLQRHQKSIQPEEPKEPPNRS